MHARFPSRLPNRPRRKHLLSKAQPLGFVPQPGQRRARERVKGLAACPAAITLQTIGVAVTAHVLVVAVRTFGRRLEVPLKTAGRLALASALPQNLYQPAPLPCRQL